MQIRKARDAGIVVAALASAVALSACGAKDTPAQQVGSVGSQPNGSAPSDSSPPTVQTGTTVSGTTSAGTSSATDTAREHPLGVTNPAAAADPILPSPAATPDMTPPQGESPAQLQPGETPGVGKVAPADTPAAVPGPNGDRP